jgi:hypothetical protein
VEREKPHSPKNYQGDQTFFNHIGLLVFLASNCLVPAFGGKCNEAVRSYLFEAFLVPESFSGPGMAEDRFFQKKAAIWGCRRCKVSI